MLKKKKKLTIKQLQVVNLLASPEGAIMKNDEVGAKVGVTGKTISRWKHQPEVQEAIQAKVRRYAGSLLPYAWDCLRKRMPKDTQAIKLYYQLLGEYKEQMELTGASGGPLQFSWLRKLSSDELEQLGEGL